jgi:hypothetical protein
MNTHELKPGDRVRVTRRNRLTDYFPGDRGRVLAGPERVAGSRLRYYSVAIEEAPGKVRAVFAEDEIEPDV